MPTGQPSPATSRKICRAVCSARLSLRPTRSGRSARRRHVRAEVAQQLRLREEVLAHPVAGEGRLDPQDRVDDRLVGERGLAQRLLREADVRWQVEQRDPVEQVHEERQGGVPGDGGEEVVQLPVVAVRPAALLLDEGAERLDVALVEPARCELGDDLLEREAGLDHLVDLGADVEEVDRHRIGDRVDRRLEHHQPAPRTTAHAGDLEVLEQPHGLAEHGAAHAVAVQQLGLGADDLALGPALLGDVAEHPVGHDGRQLRAVGPAGSGALGCLRHGASGRAYRCGSRAPEPAGQAISAPGYRAVCAGWGTRPATSPPSSTSSGWRRICSGAGTPTTATGTPSTAARSPGRPSWLRRPPSTTCGSPTPSTATSSGPDGPTSLSCCGSTVTATVGRSRPATWSPSRTAR